MAKVVLLQTVATDYRKKLFDTLKNSLGDEFQLFAGKNYFEESVKTDSSIKYLREINNTYLLNRKFLFQTGMWKEALSAGTLIMEMNPRILSNWLLLLFRKILRKKTILWGHAWPRNGKESRSDKVRHWMRQLGDVIVTYTKTQAEELQEKMPYKKIVCAPNSLYYRAEMQCENKPEISDIIYVGRLTKLKKPAILVEAFSKIVDELPANAKLIIVGDGEEKNHLKTLIQDLKLNGRVKLLGHVGDYEALKELYSKALFSVSPGYVGLSITQSFGFGVPMLISRDENHSPEIEAAIEDVNSLYFKTDDLQDLGDKIMDFYEKKNHWLNERENICQLCQDSYSIEAMAKTFLDLAKV